MCLTISGCAWEEAYNVGHQQVRRTSEGRRLLYYVLRQHLHCSPVCPYHPCPRKVSRPRSTRPTASPSAIQRLYEYRMPSMKSSRYVAIVALCFWQNVDMWFVAREGDAQTEAAARSQRCVLR